MENTECDLFQIRTVPSVKIFNSARTLMIVSIFFSDFVAIIIAILLSTIIRFVFFGSLPLDLYLWVPTYLFVFFISAFLRGLYPATGLNAAQQLRDLTMLSTLITLVILGGSFFFKTNSEFSRILVGFSWLFSLFTIPFQRTITRQIMSHLGLWGESVMVIGNTDQVKALNTQFRQSPKLGFKPIVELIIETPIKNFSKSQQDSLREKIQNIGRLFNIRVAFVAIDQLNDFIMIQEQFQDTFKHVVYVNPDDFGIDLGGLAIKQFGRMFTLEVTHNILDKNAQTLKRFIDISLSVLALILISPLLGILTMSIALDSPGGVVYRQKRLGKLGKEFDLFKFRSMYSNADYTLTKYLQQNPNYQKEWDYYQKLKKDPRITRIGSILRRFSLDELPQLFNVLKGDMSIVGPRPILVNQRKLYGKFYNQYIRVKPGMTGLWQISGRNRTSFNTRTKLDTEYIRTWSVWFDMYIIIRTIWVVLRRDGAS